MMKALVMMSGEFDYSEIFFKDQPPLGWANNWDQGWMKVPFPFLTYTTFLVFFSLVSIVAINVLVGLTVNDIRNFLENADLLKLTMRLKFSLRREWLATNRNREKRDPLTKQVDKELSATSSLVARYQATTSNLISKERVWEKEKRKKWEAEEERRNIEKLMKKQTQQLTASLNSIMVHVQRTSERVTELSKEVETLKSATEKSAH